MSYDEQLMQWKLKHGYVPPAEQRDGSKECIQLQVEADRQRKGKDYCVLCGEGPQLISGMRLITREEDPYTQLEESHEKVRACPECFKEKYQHD